MSTVIPQPAIWREPAAALRFLAAKVARVHGPGHPDAAILAEVVNTLVDTPTADRAAQAALARRMRELTGDFHPWPGACASVHQLFLGLKAVTADLPSAAEIEPS